MIYNSKYNYINIFYFKLITKTTKKSNYSFEPKSLQLKGFKSFF